MNDSDQLVEQQVRLVRNALAEAGHPDWDVRVAPGSITGMPTVAISPPFDVLLDPTDDDLRTAWRAWFLAGVDRGCLPCWLADRSPLCTHERQWA